MVDGFDLWLCCGRGYTSLIRGAPHLFFIFSFYSSLFHINISLNFVVLINFIFLWILIIFYLLEWQSNLVQISFLFLFLAGERRIFLFFYCFVFLHSLFWFIFFLFFILMECVIFFDLVLFFYSLFCFFMSNFLILCCIVLYCIVLDCIILYFITLSIYQSFYIYD